ncbi:MAG: hypothetical protein K0U84_12260 [Actinomycetia bacterium]|nr:hypothetical protein [Actinomycetes bacterium]
MSVRGRRGAGGGRARTDAAHGRWIWSRTWLIGVLVVLGACVPALSFVSGGDAHGSRAGASHHAPDHDHGQIVAQAAPFGGDTSAGHVVIADHSHVGALHQLVYPGIDGVVAALRSVNPLRVLAAVAVIAMAMVMSAVAASNRSRAPPRSGVWLGPARPGRAVIADLCVIRR